VDPVLAALTVPIVEADGRMIVAYRGLDGRVLAKEFLESLDTQAQVRYGLHFRQWCQDGQLRGKYMHPWDPKKGNKNAKGLQCFKDNESQSRIPCFPSGDPGVLVLTHGFGGKKEDKLDDKQIDRADAVRREFQARAAKMRAKGPPSTASKRSSGGRRR
jgi:hypothetical protein